MNRFLVHVQLGNPVNWLYRTPGWNLEANVPQYVRTDFNIHNQDEEDLKKHAEGIRTFAVNTQRDAEALATHLASYVPGAKIYIAEIKAMAQSAALPAVISNVTDKGIVPRA